ncbi:hypothetical protein KIN20_034791 [Parelaphostrongylus tenuis]|uniref:Alpha-2-macroglobulin domain-containing protein n=1 Tax=Parelaphostrongylus tenuis TaxID=148309 RepID=A0AAD5RAS1_PARTN|nr:hypothetical protein KIN20_034791 [Parelaphostrongylus tenuis]
MDSRSTLLNNCRGKTLLWISNVWIHIANGLWRDHIDISKCFMDGNHKATSILVQIRDRDTGDRSELSVAFDPLVPGFEIVPLRPAFSNNTKYILLMMQSISTPRGVELDVRFQCLGDVSRPSIQVKTTVGKVLSFDKPSNWDICRVIMIEASRQVGLLKSRKKSLMLPSISGVKSMEPSWIELHPSHSSYFVGERLLVTVPRNRANALSYIIICNLYSMPSSGHFEEDGSLTVIITQVMVGQCVLLVHSTDGRRATDMIEFNVEEKCQVSILSTSDSIKPAESVTLTLNGHPHGIALVRAIDDRLNTFTSEQNGKRRRSWDFLLFHQVQFGNSQAKAINFSMFDEVTRAIEQSCSSVASEYIKSFGTCPDATSSLSEISNFCLDIMISECLYPVEPTVAASNACDLRNPRGCDTDPSVVANQNGLDIRQYFYEVWLFDAVPLGPLGTVSRTVKAPDTVGRWSISSVFWTPGQRDLCAARRVVIASKKDVFMKIDLPKSVYLNETINAKVSVTAINPSRETKYTICLSEMSRKMCADLGSFGQLGEPGYSRVILSPSRPTDTKTFAIRFLDIGITSMTIIIRDEATFPGRHHCSIGEIRDIVKQKIRVAKRVETEELYKTVILDTSQPSNPVMNYAVDPSETPVDVFSVRDYRLIPAGDILVTHVHAHIPNPDIVYSFIIDISKFLPNNVVKRGGASRSQRSADYGRSFLSDILKALSVELYQFKRVKSKRYPDHRIVDNLKNRIGALLSDMFRFSDCKNESECGYAEYRSPRNPKERSIALTAISTSLLCEAAASRRLVCGSLRYLLQSLLKDWKEEDINLDELVDLEHFLDKQWFLKAFLLQVSRDCAAYECVKDDEAWFRLVSSFYLIDEEWKWDIRSLAAIAYMGTNATSEIMRIRMASIANGHSVPFWNAGSPLLSMKSKTTSFSDVNKARKRKSGDVLVNALGILAFISSGAEGRSVNWDPLANWLYEQQSPDGSFENTIDTYFASRALFEYRFRKVIMDKNASTLNVTVRCPVCEASYEVNVTKSATEIHIPTRARNLTFETHGRGKVMVGIRVIAQKRQRSRRGLSQDDPYPVRITIEQQRVFRGTLRQTVCLRVLTVIVKAVEITHGLYTGYSATSNSVEILPNSTSLSFVSPPTISSFAMHFVLDGFRHNEAQCYDIGVAEPNHNHEPLHLAPVAITARHPLYDVIGFVLISHPDQENAGQRTKREMANIGWEIDKHSFLTRYQRGIHYESIDTVCFQGGSCVCAESSCGVKCGLCNRDSSEDLKDLISNEDTFGALLRVLTMRRVLVNNSFYLHLTTEVREKQGGAKQKISDKLDVWLRDCNPRCNAISATHDDKFFIIGEAEALALDSFGKQHYVLRNVDRFERATSDCGVLSNLIILGS